MRCSNPKCHQNAHDLQSGTLRLLEMDLPPEERVVRSEWGFPVCSAPSRYFWLCAKCSQSLRIKRWTMAGLVLESFASEGNLWLPAPTLSFPPVKAALRPRTQTTLGKSA